MRRMLIREYLTAGDPAQAERHVAALRRLEPLSADVFVLMAEVAGHRQDRPAAERALREALRLEPTYGEVYARLGHYGLERYQAEMTRRGDPRRDPLVREIVAQFAQAAALDGGLTPEHRQEYATMLALAGRPEEAIAAGESLQGPGAEALRHTLALLYRDILRDPVTGARVLAALDAAHAPPPDTTPLPFTAPPVP
jgi:predicted Zn-dependent protease